MDNNPNYTKSPSLSTTTTSVKSTGNHLLTPTTTIKRGRGRPRKYFDGNRPSDLGTPLPFKKINPVGRPPGPRSLLSTPRKSFSFVVVDDTNNNDNNVIDQQQDNNQENEQDSLTPLELYNKILSPYESQITLTTPQPEDKSKFDNARHKADLKANVKKFKFNNDNNQSISPTSSPSTPSLEDGIRNVNKTPPIKFIKFGDYLIQTWYAAPYPEEYTNLPNSTLYICSSCLSYRKSEFCLSRHKLKCKYFKPPGDEIYRHNGISIFEVDGRKNKLYCQNLCLLAKMFLDHKTLYYDVEPFLFYIVTNFNKTTKGVEFVGYFSKEKRSGMGYNLSCIMTLPIRQRKGWGNFLIDFSYLLSKKEKKIGTPERPLTNLGYLSYKKYWLGAVYRALLSLSEDELTLNKISEFTAISIPDVTFTLKSQNMLHLVDNNSNGERKVDNNNNNNNNNNNITPRTRGKAPRSRFNLDNFNDKPLNSDDPTAVTVPAPNCYKIVFNRDLIQNYINNDNSKDIVRVNSNQLRWHPFM